MAEKDEKYPLAAQIPLQGFQLPDFPEQASRLRSLTLTADIKLDEYQSLVQDIPSRDETFNIPSNLPQSITNLTLELFTLGFPAGYLSSIASSLPNLKSLTLFSCLIDGITEPSRADAEAFFETTPMLAELHVLDTFARSGFWQTVGRIIQQRTKESQDVSDAGLKILEVSYTYRGFDDDGFLARVGGEEWAEYVVDGAVGLAFGLVPEADPANEATGKEPGREAGKKETQNEGILPFAVDSRASEGLRKRFKGVSKGSLGRLKMLDVSLWTLRASDIADILNSCTGRTENGEGMVDMTISILMEEGWVDRLAEALSLTGKSIEGIEIIGVPTESTEISAVNPSGKSSVYQEFTLLQQKDLEALSSVCLGLRRLAMSVLRAKSFGRVEWIRIEEGSWEERRA